MHTVIGRATGSAGFDELGNPLYRNRNIESAAEKAKRRANREIKEMAERLSADQSIIVIFVHKIEALNEVICYECIAIEFGSTHISHGSKEQAHQRSLEQRDHCRLHVHW